MAASVVVLGGGFGGVTVARHIGTRADVTIVSSSNFLLFTPMLAEVAAGDVDPRHIISPVRQLCPGARLVQGDVEAIDVDSRTATVHPPFGGEALSVSADAMVLALGGVSASFGVPGVTEFALPFKTISDGLRIRNRVLALLETSSERADPELTHVVVVGAGYSGAEVAAALADFLGRAWPRFYPTAPRPRVTMIDAVERVVPMLPARLSAKAEEALEERGVRLVLGTAVSAVDASGVELADGTRVEAATVIWAAGVRPHPMVETLGLPTDRGRLVTDRQLRVAPGVYALGDLAAVPDGRGGTSPPTAQFALRQGAYLGRHLPALLAGEDVAPFRYGSLGQLVSLGHRNAVGVVMGVRVSGFLAWFLWRSYYLFRLPTLLRKARVSIDWTLDLLFPPDIAWLPSSDLGPPPV